MTDGRDELAEAFLDLFKTPELTERRLARLLRAARRLTEEVPESLVWPLRHVHWSALRLKLRDEIADLVRASDFRAALARAKRAKVLVRRAACPRCQAGPCPDAKAV